MMALLCALPLVARLAACAAPDVLAVGYVEGEYVDLAPVTAAAAKGGTRVAALALYDQPLSDINQYVPRMQAVTAADVRAFAASHLVSKDFSVVIAGNAKEFVEPLRAQFEDVEVISQAELDLSSPALRVRKKKD